MVIYNELDSSEKLVFFLSELKSRSLVCLVDIIYLSDSNITYYFYNFTDNNILRIILNSPKSYRSIGHLFFRALFFEQKIKKKYSLSFIADFDLKTVGACADFDDLLILDVDHFAMFKLYSCDQQIVEVDLSLLESCDVVLANSIGKNFNYLLNTLRSSYGEYFISLYVALMESTLTLSLAKRSFYTLLAEGERILGLISKIQHSNLTVLSSRKEDGNLKKLIFEIRELMNSYIEKDMNNELEDSKSLLDKSSFFYNKLLELKQYKMDIYHSFIKKGVTKEELLSIKFKRRDLIESFCLGPLLQASGFNWDHRSNQSNLAYNKLNYKTILRKDGTMFDFFEILSSEFDSSMKMIDQIIHYFPLDSLRENSAITQSTFSSCKLISAFDGAILFDIEVKDNKVKYVNITHPKVSYSILAAMSESLSSIEDFSLYHSCLLNSV